MSYNIIECNRTLPIDLPLKDREEEAEDRVVLLTRSYVRL